MLGINQASSVSSVAYASPLQTRFASSRARDALRLPAGINVAMQFFGSDERSAPIFLSRDQSVADAVMQVGTTDPQNACGFSNFKTQLWKVISGRVHGRLRIGLRKHR